MSQEANPVALPGGLRLDVHPYSPQGGYSSAGSAVCILGALVAAAIMGFVTSWVGQYFYLVILFPIVVGLVVGTTLRFAIRFGKVRSPWLGGLAGLLGGALSTIMMLFFDYQRHLSEVAKLDPVILARLQNADKLRLGDMAPFGIDQAEWNEMKKAIQIVKIKNFLEYIDYAAQEGVSIGKGGQQGINLGYYGTLTYYVVEMLVIAGVALGIAKSAASEPFCDECNQWEENKEIARFLVKNDRLNGWVESYQKGHPVARSEVESLAPDGANVAVSISRCMNCGANVPLEFKMEAITLDNKGNETRTQLTHLTFPGEAEAVLQALLEEPVTEEPNQTKATDSPASEKSE